MKTVIEDARTFAKALEKVNEYYKDKHRISPLALHQHMCWDKSEKWKTGEKSYKIDVHETHAKCRKRLEIFVTLDGKVSCPRLEKNK